MTVMIYYAIVLHRMIAINVFSIDGQIPIAKGI